VFQVGSQVVYGIHGVCDIVDTQIQIVNRKKVEYFVLQPIDQPEARYFVPTQNETAMAKLKPILTRQALVDLLRADVAVNQVWIEDENQRKQQYKTLVNSGNRAALIGMVRLLHNHRKAQLATGRKFHLCDENFLRDAEKLLSSEFSLVLNIPRCDVGKYIRSIIEDTEN